MNENLVKFVLIQREKRIDMGKVLGEKATYTLDEIVKMIENLSSKDKLELIDRIGVEEHRLDISLASEQSLAKDWLSKEEDEAWKSL